MNDKEAKKINRIYELTQLGYIYTGEKLIKDDEVITVAELEKMSKSEFNILLAILKQQNKQKRLICIVGASGSGKTTIAREISKRHGIDIILGYTTRKPEFRNGRMEENGVDYYFYNELPFGITISENTFEWTNYKDNYYWTENYQYNFEGTKLIIVETEGLKALREKFDGELIVIYLVTDKFIRRDRMAKREGYTNFTDVAIDNSKLEDKICKRLNHDSKAFKTVQCDYAISNNGDMEETIKEIERIIL